MTTTDQPPLSGCERCGGPVRTRKSVNGIDTGMTGWTCAKCVKELKAEARKAGR